MFETFTKGFILFVGVLALASWLVIDWAQRQMPMVQSETIDTTNMHEYQQFQRDCLEKTDVVLNITIYHGSIKAWRLTCNWEEQP